MGGLALFSKYLLLWLIIMQPRLWGLVRADAALAAEAAAAQVGLGKLSISQVSPWACSKVAAAYACDEL